MPPLFTAIFTFALTWTAHLFLWRIHLPKSQIKALLVIFLVAWCCAVFFTWFFDQGFILLGDGQRVVGLLYFSFIYWLVALCYTITYSAMEGDSPTLSLTRYLHKKGTEGISHEEIEKFFRQRPFVGSRVKALVADNILIEESGGYKLASGKFLFFRLILGYRRVVFGTVKAGG
ncbi:MAG: hypothetical protein EBR59_07760 [Methylococcaceae bacterium]|nr:hypothetical protein [Methylococcaceae bacterium]